LVGFQHAPISEDAQNIGDDSMDGGIRNLIKTHVQVDPPTLDA
jgi:hypothetical protein